jgi:ATP-dependent Clp protease ATP-binding subunit ClpA
MWLMVLIGAIVIAIIILSLPATQYGLLGLLITGAALELSGWLVARRSVLALPLAQRRPAAVAGAGPRPAAGAARSTPAAVSWHGERRTTEAERARELDMLDNLRDYLRSRVRGQDHIAEPIILAMKRRAAGVTSQERPLSILLAGPTGVGKTETAKTLAHGLGRPLIVYDMGNYHDMYTAAALIGAPPGYMGSDQPGRLVTDLLAHPNAILLFDEIEKAHPKIFDTLLAALDQGQVAEISQGQVAPTSGAIWIFTTNLLQAEAARHPDATDSEVRRMLLSARSPIQDTRISGGLRPEFVNRISLVLLFRPLSREVMADIASAYLHQFIGNALRGQQLNGISVDIDRAVLDHLLDHCDLTFGVRDLQRAVDSEIATPLAEAYRPWMRSSRKPAALSIGVADGRVVVEYQEARP